MFSSFLEILGRQDLFLIFDPMIRCWFAIYFWRQLIHCTSFKNDFLKFRLIFLLFRVLCYLKMTFKIKIYWKYCLKIFKNLQLFLAYSQSSKELLAQETQIRFYSFWFLSVLFLSRLLCSICPSFQTSSSPFTYAAQSLAYPYKLCYDACLQAR